MLVEAAWHYRHHPFLGRRAAGRQRGAPAAPSIARVDARNSACIAAITASPRAANPNNIIVTAVARELTGFVWAALTQ